MKKYIRERYVRLGDYTLICLTSMIICVQGRECKLVSALYREVPFQV